MIRTLKLKLAIAFLFALHKSKYFNTKSNRMVADKNICNVLQSRIVIMFYKE